MSVTQIIHQKDGSAEVRFRYDPIFVEKLKSEIPSYQRSYDPHTKVWTIERPYVDRVIFMARQRFGYLEEFGEPVVFNLGAESSHHACTCDVAHRILKVCQDAPPEVIRAAYRALSKLNHPDSGGDHHTMIELTEAYEAVIGGAA